MRYCSAARKRIVGLVNAPVVLGPCKIPATKRRSFSFSMFAEKLVLKSEAGKPLQSKSVPARINNRQHLNVD